MRNRSREGALSARRPNDDCAFARRHCVNRVNRARTHQRWFRQQWNSVLFCDKSRFTIHRGDGRVRVYRRRNERCIDCFVLERDRVRGGSSVWFPAGIAHGFRTNLVVIQGNSNAQRNRNEILVRNVISLFQNNDNITPFQHDDTTSHTARDTEYILRANNIAFINDYPAKSPDLNRIEHLWDYLDYRIRRRPIPPSNVIQLRQAFIQEWNNIPRSRNQYTYPFCAKQSFMLKLVIPVLIWDFGELPFPHFKYHFATFG